MARADILVNNAAIWYGVSARPWDALTVEQWDQMFVVNVRGTWVVCQAIAPLMIKQKKGKIINIASNVAKVPAAQLFLPYACTKGAVYILTHALARALGPSGINVNAIAPGYVATEASLGQPNSDKIFEIATGEQSIHQRLLVPARLNQFGLDVTEWNPGGTSTSGKILFFLVIAAIFTAVRNRLVARKRPAP